MLKTVRKMANNPRERGFRAPADSGTQESGRASAGADTRTGRGAAQVGALPGHLVSHRRLLEQLGRGQTHPSPPFPPSVPTALPGGTAVNSPLGSPWTWPHPTRVTRAKHRTGGHKELKVRQQTNALSVAPMEP